MRKSGSTSISNPAPRDERLKWHIPELRSRDLLQRSARTRGLHPGRIHPVHSSILIQGTMYPTNTDNRASHLLLYYSPHCGKPHTRVYFISLSPIGRMYPLRHRQPSLLQPKYLGSHHVTWRHSTFKQRWLSEHAHCYKLYANLVFHSRDVLKENMQRCHRMEIANNNMAPYNCSLNARKFKRLLIVK